MARHNAYRDGKVHVCAEMCPTCVFRPGNLMRLEPGRLKELIVSNVDNGAGLICHETHDIDNAICAGFFERHVQDVTALTLAVAMRMIERVKI